jgi:hypothetical protein
MEGVGGKTHTFVQCTYIDTTPGQGVQYRKLQDAVAALRPTLVP